MWYFTVNYLSHNYKAFKLGLDWNICLKLMFSFQLRPHNDSIYAS